MCLLRDQNTCQICHLKNDDLDIHHKDGNGYGHTNNPDNDLSNLISVCHSCHMKSHYGVMEKHKDIIALYQTGFLTQQEIGAQYGVTRQCIQQILKRNGIGRIINRDMARYDGLRKLNRNRELVEYAKAHPELAMREIGELYNISESRVSRILKRAKT
jgi:DNA-directed RNA polymerase specialized sigma subunit